MAIILVRHGETEFNRTRVVQVPSTPLNATGVAQAERLAVRLADFGISRILSSDYVRAAMTAERIQSATGVPIRHTSLLQERNYGDVRGMAYTDIGEDIFAPDYAPPRGETWEVFHSRVNSAWDETVLELKQGNGNLAVVTHGLVCYSLALRHLRLPDGCVAPREWGNTAVTVVDPVPPWRVRLLNCTAHLNGELGGGGQTISGI